MDTNKILHKLVGNVKKVKSSLNQTTNKPIKNMKISGKSVQIFNNNTIPKKSVIKKAYDKIPDDTNIPLQFMTRKQYMNKYIKNQESINNVDFTPQQEKEFIKRRTPVYDNILGRYTTKTNNYYPPAVVVFNDKDNFKNIKGDKFDDLVFHEYGHELVEKKGMKMPLHKEELFSDHIADYGQKTKIFSDTHAKNYALNKTKHIHTDKSSKDKTYYHGTSKKNLSSIQLQGLKSNSKKTSAFSKDDAVYMTPSEKYAALYAQQTFSDPVLLKLDVDENKVKDSEFMGIVNPENIVSTRDVSTEYMSEYNNTHNNIWTDTKSKNMARFSASEENEIVGVDWNKSQKGKKIGEGNFGVVYEVKDNPKYVIKVPKTNNGSYYGSIKEEMTKFDMYGDNDLIAPSFETSQGIVREKLNIVSRGATKQDWDNKDPRVSGYSFFEQTNISKDQAKQVVSGVNQLSDNNVLIDDELQIGIGSSGKPYLYDIGTLHSTKPINYDGYARDENDQYKQRFLEGVKQEDLFDRDYEKESVQSEQELKNISIDDDSKNKGFKFWQKKPQEVEYNDLTDSSFRKDLSERQYLQKSSYGEVQDYSGDKVGNTMIAADMIIPSGKTLTAAGFGMKKYVDKIRLVKTDEHDNRYKIPKVEIHRKDSKFNWKPTHKGSGASIEKQEEWQQMSLRQRNLERQSKLDTDGDRVPDEYDCEPNNIMRQDTVYSVRHDNENSNERIYVSDADRNKYSRVGKMRGRGTGWYGTGAYAFDSKDKAEDTVKNRYLHDKSAIRTFEIKKPLYLNKHESEKLHDVSKTIYKSDDEHDLKMAGMNLRFQTGKEFSVPELRAIKKEARTRGVQPINIITQAAGYDGIIPHRDFQNTTYGSVKHYDYDVGVPKPGEEDIFDKRQEEINKKYEAERQRRIAKEEVKYELQKQKEAEEDYKRELEMKYRPRTQADEDLEIELRLMRQKILLDEDDDGLLDVADGRVAGRN